MMTDETNYRGITLHHHSSQSEGEVRDALVAPQSAQPSLLLLAAINQVLPVLRLPLRS